MARHCDFGVSGGVSERSGLAVPRGVKRGLALAVVALVGCGLPDVQRVVGVPDAPAPALGGSACRPAGSLRDVAYGPAALQQLDVYYPASCSPVPIVVHVHGGGWSAGDKWPVYGGADAAALARGLALVSINYRLAPGTIWPGQRDDVTRALAFVRSKAAAWGMDSSRVGVWGGSAGGHLAAWAGVLGQAQAVVTWFGPVDFKVEDAALVANGYSVRAGLPGSHEAVLLGVPRLSFASASLAWSASPLSVSPARGVRWRIEHGALDRAIPWQQATLLGAHVRVAPLIRPNVGHSGLPWQSSSAVGSMLDWLKAVL